MRDTGGDVMTFGKALRAARLGYGFSEKHRAFIRLSDPMSGKVHISVVPEDKLIPATAPGKYHRCWWEGPDHGQNLLDMVPVLRHLTRVKTTIGFYVDAETGE